MNETLDRPHDTGPDAGAAGDERFVVHRPARSHPRPVPTGEVVVAPPPIRRGAATGWLPALLPLLGSAGSLLLLGATAPGRRWLVLAVIGSLLLSLGATLVPPLRQRRDARRRRARYLDHLADVARALERTAAAQRAAAEHLYPDLPAILALVGDRERLWERRPADEDFLTVRVGRGPVPLATPVRLDHGPDPLAERDPELLAAAEELVRRGGRLGASPAVVPLRRAGVLAVTGPRAPARALTRFMLAQVAAFHAPEDVRVLAAYPAADAPVWEWLKWLPHVRERIAGPGTPVPRCLLAASAERLTVHLERELRPRLAALAGGPPARLAHLLVVLDGFSPRGPLGRVPLLDELLGRAAELGATVLCLAERRADEPAELGGRIVLDGTGGVLLEEAGPGGTGRRARADGAGRACCEAIARHLAPLRPARRRNPEAPALRAPVRLLELLGLGEAAAIDPAETWRRHPAAGRLRVPVGLRGARDLGTLSPDPLVLDLKEAADGGMGPHGLLVGATGSGKSELLRTIVTGLALAHPPELLSFVLVDFKGGAAFAGLDALPHTAGVITNLQADLALVDRALAALQGEQERRQRLLRRAGNLDGIARYQARRAADPSLEPMPNLLLVVDEFGELLAARPEFLDVLTAIGRVGRSLGMHLLLASQRLDEGRVRGLESHLRYRICLRTFTPADSMAVLGTADAHALPPSPGCGWLKVDGDTQRFEGAVVSVAAGGRHAPPPTAVILPFEPARPPAVEPSPPDLAVAGPGDGPPERVADRRIDDAGADMDAVVAALSRPGGPCRRARRVWLPPLAAAVTLDAVLAEVPRPAGTGWRPGTEGWLRVPVGVVDKPREQAQEPLVLDFTGAAGHLAVVGAPRSGKSTLLATIAAAFALTHAPDAVQLYGVDLGGGLLHQLAGLPHVGAVCGRHDRDQARHLVRELRALVATRERASRDTPDRLQRDLGPASLFPDVVAGAFPADRAACGLRGGRGPAPLPAGPEGPSEPEPDGGGHGEVLLLVDNWARLRQELGDLEPEIEALAASGLHHGVHLVVAANRWADLRLALRDNLGGRLELHLNDPLESAVGRAAAAALPADLPGRGLTATGLWFQAALPLVGGPVGDVSGDRWLAAAAAELTRKAVPGRDGVVAPPLRMLPAVVHRSDLPVRVDDVPGAVPLGLHEHRHAPVWLDLHSGPPHFLVLGDAECGKTSVLRCIAGGLSTRSPEEVRLVVVDYRRGLSDLAELPQCGAHAFTPGMAVETVARLRRALEQRLTLRGPLPPPPWGGPRHLLLVDDYHLVAGGGNPLEPLLDLLAYAGDIGLHVVLTCAAAAASRAAFDPFLRRLHELGSPGLLMSGDPREGPLLGGHAAFPLPPGRGRLVRRQGTSGLVQVAWTPPPVATVTLRSHPP